MKASLIRRLAHLSARNNNAGFSITEAVVVIALGLTLTAIAAPAYTTFKNTFATKATDVQTELNSKETAANTAINGVTRLSPPPAQPGS